MIKVDNLMGKICAINWTKYGANYGQDLLDIKVILSMNCILWSNFGQNMVHKLVLKWARFDHILMYQNDTKYEHLCIKINTKIRKNRSKTEKWYHFFEKVVPYRKSGTSLLHKGFKAIDGKILILMVPLLEKKWYRKSVDTQGIEHKSTVVPLF